eukprot:TRINITY_DN9747_c0_g1_i1.p1 TRINITY_DN9747_c0_g1~~TRINITY_DN9747_c0_g1_i1.p1  ORF type:complete len:398 (+),score=110.23 TRINITY_DN9747_c0_g1_i1:46-1239(+)
MGDPPDRRSWKRGGVKRKRYEEAVEEKTVVVKCNNKPDTERWTLVVAVEDLEQPTTEGFKAAVGDAFFGKGRPAAELYHEDGIRMMDISLLKDGETVYATAGQFEMYVGVNKDAKADDDPASTEPSPQTKARSESPAPAVIPVSASVALRQVLTSKADFVPSETFVGAKPGYIFAALDDRGPGYHRDIWKKTNATAHARANMADLLSQYGGGDHLGRCRDVHGLNETSGGGGAAGGHVALPAMRVDAETMRALPSRPTEEQMKDDLLRRKAEEQRREELAKAEASITPAEASAKRKGTLAGLAQMMRNEMLGEDAKVRMTEDSSSSFAKFRAKQQQKERRAEKAQETKAATEALKSAGLVEASNEDDDQPFEKREKMSKRAKKRARLREEKDAGQAQ